MDQQIVLILVGLIGSGKSTFAQALEHHFPNFRRCNQDELGNRRRVETLVSTSLQRGFSVCIDRTNIDASQRAHFINIAQEFPNVPIWVIVFDTPYEICASRVTSRTDHPTIATPELGLSVLERFATEYVPPTAEEGFDRIATLKPHITGDYTRDDIAAILDSVRNMPKPAPSHPGASSRNLQYFRAPERMNSNGSEHWRQRAPPLRQTWRNDTPGTGVDSSSWRRS